MNQVLEEKIEKIMRICEGLGPRAARFYYELIKRGGCAKFDEIDMSRTVKYVVVRKLLSTGLIKKDSDVICIVEEYAVPAQ